MPVGERVRPRSMRNVGRRPVGRKWNAGGGCKKSGPFLTFLNAGCIMYSISIFYCKFYLFGGGVCMHPPCLRPGTTRKLSGPTYRTHTGVKFWRCFFPNMCQEYEAHTRSSRSRQVRPCCNRLCRLQQTTTHRSIIAHSARRRRQRCRYS